MKKATKSAVFLFCLFFSVWPARGEAPQLKPNDLWPAISLPLPADPAARQYLGVKQGDTFVIGALPAEAVVVEIFSMYCPICQREASKVNKLYALIDGRAGLGRKLKIIGIGAGNSDFEVNYFRRNYAIPFPLFADGDFVIHKKVGEVRTPHFFVLKPDKHGQARVVFVHSGGFKTAEAFLEETIKRCGLK